MNVVVLHLKMTQCDTYPDIQMVSDHKAPIIAPINDLFMHPERPNPNRK